MERHPCRCDFHDRELGPCLCEEMVDADREVCADCEAGHHALEEIPF